MRIHNLLPVFAFVVSGCVTATKSNYSAKPVFTMQTDMYPNSISRAEYYEQMGISYSAESQSERAIENFRLSLLHDPKRVSSYIELSDEYRKTNRNHLALVELEEALKLEPDNFNVLNKIGDLYLSNKLYSKAREIYQRMLLNNERREEAQWALFYLYKLERNFETALQLLVNIKTADENRYKIIYEKALIYKALNDSDEYEFNLKKAYKMNPRDRDVVLEYVEYAFNNKKFQDSTQALRKYLDTHNFEMLISQKLSYSAVQSENYEIALRELNKQRPFTRDLTVLDLKRAHVYYLSEELENAEKLYLKILSHEDNDEARFYLSQIYITQNKAEDAAFIMNQIPVSSEYYGEARVRLTLYQKYKGESDKAMNTIREAFIQRPDQLVIYQTYADFLIESKRYVETVALLEKGIQLFKYDEDLRLKMAYLHYRLNNPKAFKQQIMMALKINPNNAEVYSMLAELWYLKDKKPEDVKYFAKKALQLKTRNHNVKPLLAWALMQENNSTEAVAIFEEFYEENPNESFFARSLSQVYRRADIKEKSRALAKVATSLESNSSLKSRFMFKDKTDQVQAQEFKSEPTRLPASLEK